MTEIAHLPRLFSSAERMRRYRLRRRLGHSCVTVELRGDAALVESPPLPTVFVVRVGESARSVPTTLIPILMSE
jgi:hypothetical protein